MNDETENKIGNGSGSESPRKSDSGAASAAYKHLWNLKFRVLYSLKWHAGLCRFWKFWEELAVVLPVLLSLSVVGILLDSLDSRVSIALAVANAVLSLFSIVKGFGRRVFFYDSQRKRYSEIFNKLERPNLTDKDVEELWDEFNGVETADWDEGLDAFDISCYNKTAIQLGVPESCLKLPWYRALTMCFF